MFWGTNAGGTMIGAGGVGGLLMVNAGSGGVHFPAYDLNGNVMGLVNATNGIISAKYEYGPFGEVFCSVGDMAKVNPFGFSTKYTDNETDLLYYGYRYYSPALGRWMSRDPIEEKGGLNLYGFVDNDPVNKWDKLGLTGIHAGYYYTEIALISHEAIELFGKPYGFGPDTTYTADSAWKLLFTPGVTYPLQDEDGNIYDPSITSTPRTAIPIWTKPRYLPYERFADDGSLCSCNATPERITKCANWFEFQWHGSYYIPPFRVCHHYAMAIVSGCCLEFDVRNIRREM